MSEEKRRKDLQPQLEPAAARVSCVLRKLARAASTNRGSDCYLHAQLGGALLSDLGFQTSLVLGFAAWRVGEGDGDVIGHTPRVTGYLAPGAPQGAVYHAWLDCGGLIVDFTTYELRRKAQLLDAADGGHTSVLWCPDYLVLDPTEVCSYEEVAKSPRAGVAYYEPSAEPAALLGPELPPDPESLAMARWVLTHPGVNVFGPNDLARFQG